jgi:hypothetical protein
LSDRKNNSSILGKIILQYSLQQISRRNILYLSIIFFLDNFKINLFFLSYYKLIYASISIIRILTITMATPNNNPFIKNTASNPFGNSSQDNKPLNLNPGNLFSGPSFYSTNTSSNNK